MGKIRKIKKTLFLTIEFENGKVADVYLRNTPLISPKKREKINKYIKKVLANE